MRYQPHCRESIPSSNARQVDCTSTVAGLCRVSRGLHYAATPKLYSKIGILYKSSHDISLVNFSEASIKDTESLEKGSTPFTASHWHHLRYVRSLIIVDATQGLIQVPTNVTYRRRGTCLDPSIQQVDAVFGKLEQILRKMVSPKSIRWLKRDARVPLPDVVLETIGKKFGDSLNRLHLDILSHVDHRSIGGKIGAAIGRMTCLKKLELTGVAQNETVEVVRKYLQSPAGKSVRELRLEGVPIWGPSRHALGLQKLLGLDTDTTTRLEIESLHLRNFHPDQTDTGKSLAVMVNPKTLTSITLIDCGPLVKQLKGAGPFPNLKRLYLGGAYQHIPMVFDELPVLEELIISVDARIEQQFYGGITRYFKQKGLGLRRLGVLFTQREGHPATDGGDSTSYKHSEQAFMGKIRDHCKNLEELGIWHTDIFVSF